VGWLWRNKRYCKRKNGTGIGGNESKTVNKKKRKVLWIIKKLDCLLFVTSSYSSSSLSPLVLVLFTPSRDYTKHCFNSPPSQKTTLTTPQPLPTHPPLKKLTPSCPTSNSAYSPPKYRTPSRSTSSIPNHPATQTSWDTTTASWVTLA